MNLNQISVFLENKPGMMYVLADILAKNNIDMRALSLAETSDFGIARIIVDDAYKASTVLKDEGFINNITPVLGVAIPDEPGGLLQVLDIFNQNAINVEYMYAFSGENDPVHAYMIFRVENNKAAENALSAKGIRTLGNDELAQL